MKSLKFASVKEACQYLSDITGQRIKVAAITPDEGDYIVILHPLEDKFYVLKYPGKSSHFNSSDIVEDPSGKKMTFPSSFKLKQIAQFIEASIFALAKDKRKMTVEELKSFIPNILMADNITADRNIPKGSVDFAVSSSNDGSGVKLPGKTEERNYHALSHDLSKEEVIKSISRTKAEQKEEESAETEKARLERIKKLKKSPKNRYNKERFEEKKDFSNTKYQNTFFKASSVEEAIQYLSDITGSVIKIRN